MNVLQDIIYPAMSELKAGAPELDALPLSPETALLGSGSMLDSLALVTLVVSIEGQLADKAGVPIALANERALSQRASPFRTVATLAAYIQALLDEQQIQ
jgi:acyl carrier protein